VWRLHQRAFEAVGIPNAAIVVGVGMLAVRPSRNVVRGVRLLAVAVAVASAIGVYVHIDVNYQSGPLDYRYAAIWETMPDPTRWWAALSKTVGPAPPVAPGVLAQASLGPLFATVRHPALAEDPE